jgi:O-antigen/teichoic acid export membrane protein
VAILRGTCRLKAIASTSALVAGCTLLFALFFYSIWGISGVIPVLLLTTLATFLLHLRVSTRQFPYHISPFRFRVLRSGRPLIQLGAAYVGAGILGSGTEMLIRATVVNSENGLYAAGLYAAGLTLTVSYARMIFVAMDADYFPRLSAATQDISRQNLTVNSQIHVLSLLMAPFLIILAISLPLVVRLLYSAEYLPVMPMVWAALPFMYFKSIYSPIAYLSLAHGDSRVYFVMELLYDVVFAAAVVVGYQYYGLLGAGIGLSLANLADLLLLSLFYRKKYQFRFTRQGALLFLPQGILLLGVLCCMLLESVWLRYGISGALCCLSVLFSFIQLKKLWRSRPTA